jgi:hypothetical protein
MTGADEDEIEGDVAYAVRAERALLGTTSSTLATYASTDPEWLAEQQCAFRGEGISCVSFFQQIYASGTTATAEPGGLFLNWASPSWSYDAGDNQKIIAHELFHTIEFAHDHISPGLPPDQIPASGPVWWWEGSPEMVGYLVACERQLFTSYKSVFKTAIEQTKQSDVPLDQLETLSQTQQTGVWDVLWVAVDHLATTTGGLHALIDYLDDLGAGMTWPDAFQHAFAMTVADYYANFAAYRAKL